MTATAKKRHSCSWMFATSYSWTTSCPTSSQNSKVHQSTRKYIWKIMEIRLENANHKVPQGRLRCAITLCLSFRLCRLKLLSSSLLFNDTPHLRNCEKVLPELFTSFHEDSTRILLLQSCTMRRRVFNAESLSCGE